jgi:adenylate cyclase
LKEKKTASRFPLRFCVALSVLFTVLYFTVGLFAHQEEIWSDVLQRRTHGARKADERILLIAMDDDTVKKYGLPPDRKYHAQLLDRLKELGVKTVAFDVMFLEDKPGDSVLVEATKRFKRVVHLYLAEPPRDVNLPGGGKISATINEPIAGLVKAAQYLAYPNVDRVLDEDGHIRRARLFDERVLDPRGQIPHGAALNIAALASYEGKPLKDYYEIWGGENPREIRVRFRRPKDWLLHEKRDAGRNLANPETYEGSYRRISMMDIIQGNLSAGEKQALKGSLAIVGSTALGYFDHYPSPFLSSVPGAEYHCNIIDNIIHGDYLVDQYEWTVPAFLLLIWVPFFLLRLSPALSAATMGLVFFLWTGLCWLRFTQGVFLEYVAPAVALLVSFLVLTVHRVLTEGQEKKFIKDLFGQFVAPEVVEDLARDPSKVQLGGEKRDMTMFFLDIAHFTTISEKMDPEKLLLFLNKYLSALSHIVHEQKGVVDKYIGDCIMAFWNAPLPVPDHRVRACLAAIDCQAAIKVLNKDLDPSVGEVPAIRIGLNSGTVTVGLTGSEKKLQYTVIGDEVNLASRLEGANKFFGSGIMAAQSTYEGAKDVVEARELGRVRVVGKATPIKVYELLARKGQLSPEWQKGLPLYEKALALFQAGKYADSAVIFEQVLRIFPEDGPAEFYLNTSRDYSAIPPDNWDGVINLTAK